jgi:hypothetical protein
MPANVIILDSNLLLLLVTGLTERSYISKHKRLQTYEESDFDLLKNVIEAAGGVIVTPNTLTETSNLVGQIREPARRRIYEQLRLICTKFEERYVKSSRAAGCKEFLRLGLADAAQLELMGETHVLLTVDHDLYVAAIGRGMKAENFNHSRLM